MTPHRGPRRPRGRQPLAAGLGLMAPVLAATLALAQPVAASPYGLNAHIPPEQLVERIAEAGIPWVRIDFLWSLVEPEQDHFQWGTYDTLVDQAMARGLRIYASVGSTPAWATNGTPGTGVPDDPNDWYDVVFRAVSRYRGRIDHWGLWNEPNLPRFWEGTRRQYIDVILRPGSAAIRDANPDARVCGPELAHLSAGSWDSWLRQILQEASDALDIVTHHVYPPDNTAAGVIRRLNRNPTIPSEPPPVRRILQDAGWFGRPFWLTETGVQSGPPGGIQEFTQGSFYNQLVADLFGPQRAVSWVDRVFFYELADDPRYPETWGILGPPPDYAPKVAFASYANAIAATLTDVAEVTAVDFPTVLAPGQPASARITVRNTGTSTWTTAAGYRLAAFGDQDPFAAARHDFPTDVEVSPGEAYTFSFPLQAPEGVPPEGVHLATEWRMVREGAWHFGDLVTRRVRVVAEPPEVIHYLPATANAPGLRGTRWRTDVDLHNRSLDAARVIVEALEHGRDNTHPRRAELSLHPFSHTRLTNVLATLFGLSGTASLRWLVTGGDVSLASRTYTEGAGGTSGQFTPPSPIGSALEFGDTAHLLLLAGAHLGAGGFRTNIGFINPGPDPVQVELDFFRLDGAPAGSLVRALQPFEHRQLNNALGSVGAADLEQTRAAVRPITPGGRVIPYASVVDNLTGDPIYVAPAEPLTGTAFITNVAHTPGLLGTYWRTALHLHNPGPESVLVELELLPGGSAGDRPRHSLWLPAGADFWSDDVVEELFAFTGPAGLRLDVSGGVLLAASRTSTSSPAGGSLGQHVPAVPLERALGAGDTARLLLLAHSADEREGFRTNLGLLNATGTAISVTISLFSSPWQFLGTIPVSLPPHGWVQLNRVFRQATGADVPSGWAQVTSNTPGARFFAYASVVDNLTGDPIYVPGQ